MGGPTYSFASRSARADSLGYATKSASETFTQINEKRIHESMDPKNIRLRESRDSEVHPLTFPIIFGMDVTGSMQEVPHMLIKEGLPKMMSDIIQSGVTSPAVLFLALGDSAAGDKAPLQVGQFESGDAELDQWLTRTWPEGKGGGNTGESYLWAWYFAAKHCQTDAWDKREEKGLLVTFGDEPCVDSISVTEMREVMGLEIQVPLKAKELLQAAQEKWNVFHIHLTDHSDTPKHWKDWLGQKLIEVRDYHDIPTTVARLAKENCSYCSKQESSSPTVWEEPKGPDADMPITL